MGHRRIARDRPSPYGIEDVPLYRRAGACPPPCLGLSDAREGQALALRYGGRWLGHRRIARDRPSPYGIEDVPFIVGRGPVPRHAWVIKCSRGTGPRPTGGGRWLGHRAIARDRPSPYGWKMFRFIVGRGPVPRHAAVYRTLARDRPSRYGMGTAIGPSNARIEIGRSLLRERRQSRHNLHRLQTYRNHRPDELHNPLRGLRIVRVVGDLTSIVCLDPVLIQHPL